MPRRRASPSVSRARAAGNDPIAAGAGSRSARGRGAAGDRRPRVRHLPPRCRFARSTRGPVPIPIPNTWSCRRGRPIRTTSPGTSSAPMTAAARPRGRTPFPQDLPRGIDQATMVLATPEAEAEFGFVADAPLTPAGRLDPAAGAICWETLDCAAWGGFSGSLPSAAGTASGSNPRRHGPATDDRPGVPDPLGGRRRPRQQQPPISAPSSRARARTPSLPASGPAKACRAGPAAAAIPAAAPPDLAATLRETILRQTPAKRSRDRTPSFRFGADEDGAGFECRIDARPFRSCSSPFTAARLALGRHTFNVRARGDSGALDPAPASYRFRICRRR